VLLGRIRASDIELGDNNAKIVTRRYPSPAYIMPGDYISYLDIVRRLVNFFREIIWNVIFWRIYKITPGDYPLEKITHLLTLSD